MITATALLTVALVAAAQPAPALIHAQQQTQQLSTEQMYRNYMESGSIYYGNNAFGPPGPAMALFCGP